MDIMQHQRYNISNAHPTIQNLYIVHHMVLSQTQMITYEGKKLARKKGAQVTTYQYKFP